MSNHHVLLLFSVTIKEHLSMEGKVNTGLCTAMAI
jgi:hypothetical protein